MMSYVEYMYVVYRMYSVQWEIGAKYCRMQQEGKKARMFEIRVGIRLKRSGVERED